MKHIPVIRMRYKWKSLYRVYCVSAYLSNSLSSRADKKKQWKISMCVRKRKRERNEKTKNPTSFYSLLKNHSHSVARNLMWAACTFCAHEIRKIQKVFFCSFVCLKQTKIPSSLSFSILLLFMLRIKIPLVTNHLNQKICSLCATPKRETYSRVCKQHLYLSLSHSPAEKGKRNAKAIFSKTSSVEEWGGRIQRDLEVDSSDEYDCCRPRCRLCRCVSSRATCTNLIDLLIYVDAKSKRHQNMKSQFFPCWIKDVFAYPSCHFR